MRSLRIRSILAILSIPAVAACTASAPRDTTGRCNGRRVVVVSNDWNRPVDVYASTGGILGIVDPGRREEFILPESATWAYARSSYRRGQQGAPRRFVRIRYECQ
jgi:hypothetical protein